MLKEVKNEKEIALKKMKLFATSIFILMALIFISTLHFVNIPFIGYINSFAESAMVGALADWFAVVALFKHPLGIPIWHTAIIPKKKKEIGKNLAFFVESRLLSIDAITNELKNVSASKFIIEFISVEANKVKITDFVSDGILYFLNQIDDSIIKKKISNLITEKLNNLQPAPLFAKGLDILIKNGKHEIFINNGINFLSEWLPTHRQRIKIIIENYLEKILKWGSNLVPDTFVESITEKALETIIEQLNEAQKDKNHVLRVSIEEKLNELTLNLATNPDYSLQLNEWKNGILNNSNLKDSIDSLWDKLKLLVIEDLDSNDKSKIKNSILQFLENFQNKIAIDPNLQSKIDDSFRNVVVTIIKENHTTIGNMINKVIDSWDEKKLSYEIETNLGRDLQFIRLNGTIIGGFVGLLIHFIKGLI